MCACEPHNKRTIEEKASTAEEQDWDKYKEDIDILAQRQINFSHALVKKQDRFSDNDVKVLCCFADVPERGKQVSLTHVIYISSIREPPAC